MRIAFANAPFRRGTAAGRNVHVVQFVANAVALGHQIWTWRSDQNPGGQELPDGKLAQLRALRQMDAIYVRLGRSATGFCRWTANPYRKLLNDPVMVWEFNTLPNVASTAVGDTAGAMRDLAILRRHAPGCDLAICVSSMLADWVRNELGIGRVLVVPNGSDPDLFRPDAPPARPILRKAGQLQVAWTVGSAGLGWHDFGLLQSAADILWQTEGERVALHVVGEAPAGSMLEMPPNVHFWGAEEYESMPRWLAAMDVGLCLYRPGPADYGSPLKLFDYMSSGLAVVGTHHPQIREVLAEMGDPGMLIPTDDPAALAELLAALAHDPERVARHGRAGRELVQERYNWRRAVEVTMEEIDAIRRERALGTASRLAKADRDSDDRPVPPGTSVKGRHA